jgi:NAD+ diphosphatase
MVRAMADLLYVGRDVDRAHHLRKDAARLAALAAAGALVVPLWRENSLVADSRAVLAEGADAARLLAEHADPVFLGLAGGRPLFAVDVSAIEAGGRGRALGLPGRFVPLRAFGPALPAEDGAILAHARALLLWHARHRFCPACGAPAASAEAGHVRRCTSESCGIDQFPRTDPAVIMLVEDGERLLLHRQKPWPAGMWSVLAGFLEPGETLEQAVVREVAEETGIKVAELRYVASQPWPFPASLMVAFTARAVGGTLTPAFDELEDARWFSRAELDAFDDRHRGGGGGLFLANPGTAARLLVDGWRARVTAAGGR